MSNPEQTDQSAPEQKKPKASFFKSLALTSSSSMISIVALFLETLIAIRLLVPSEYGVYVLMVVVTNFLAMFIDLGCKTAVIQLVASSDDERQAALTNTVILFRVLISVLMAGLILAGRPVLNWFDPSGGLVIYAYFLPVMLLSVSLEQLFDGLLKGFQNYKQVAIAQITRSFLRLIVTLILLAVFELGIAALAISWTLSFAASALYQFWHLPIRKRLLLRLPALKDIIWLGFPIHLTSLLWYISSQVHIFLLSTLGGAVSVAFYDVASKIPTALQRLSDSFISVYYPTISSLLGKGEHKKAADLVSQSLRLGSFVIAAGVLFSALFSKQLVVLLFSEQYEAASFAFAILMLSFHMSFLVHLLGYTITAAGYPSRSLVENSTRTAVSITIDIILIPIMGYVGAAFASLISNYTANPVASWLLKRSGISAQHKAYLIQTFILLLCTGVGFWLDTQLINMATLIALKLVLLAVFVGSNLAFSTISFTDIYTLIPKRVLEKLGVKKHISLSEA